MRSESRTEETSGLVTTTATSAWRMASVAPRSMPAGLSQITQSNFSAQLAHHPGDALLGERVLVARLRGRQDRQRVEALVADQRLGELGVALHDVDEVVDDAALGPHDEVEVAQADVEIDHHDVLPALRERRAERGRRRGLADPALARCHHQNLRHSSSPFHDRFSSRRFHRDRVAVEPRLNRRGRGTPSPCPRRSGRGRRSPSSSASSLRQKMRARVSPIEPAMARPRSVP